MTVHGGRRPPLEQLIGRTIRRRSSPGWQSRQAVALLLEAVVDRYDQLISEAEAEVDELRQGRAAGGMMRIGPDDFLRVRRRMVRLQHTLLAERGVLAPYAASAPAPGDTVRLPWIRQSLESVVAVVLGASCLTFAVTALIMSLAATRASAGLTAGFLAGVVLLAAVRAAVLLFERGRRWL